MERFDQLYGYNPAKAKELLKEAGYAPGTLPLKIVAFTNPGESEGPQVAEALRIYFKDVGIDATIEVLDWAKVRDMARSKSAHCCIWPNIITWRPSEELIRGGYSGLGNGHNFVDEFIQKNYHGLDSGRRCLTNGSASPGRLATISTKISPTSRCSGSTMRWP